MTCPLQVSYLQDEVLKRVYIAKRKTRGLPQVWKDMRKFIRAL